MFQVLLLRVHSGSSLSEKFGNCLVTHCISIRYSGESLTVNQPGKKLCFSRRITNLNRFSCKPFSLRLSMFSLRLPLRFHNKTGLPTRPSPSRESQSTVTFSCNGCWIYYPGQWSARTRPRGPECDRFLRDKLNELVRFLSARRLYKVRAQFHSCGILK